MKTTHFIPVILLLLLSAAAGAQSVSQQRLPIGVRTEHTGLVRSRTYQYGLAERLELYQVLPIVARDGTARQRRRAIRLQKRMIVSSTLNLAGITGIASTGFLGPGELAGRRRIYAVGGGLLLLNLAISATENSRARRLVQAYNDTLVARQEAYVRSGADFPTLTLADTVALSRRSYRYRGVVDGLPTRTSHFNWENSRPRSGAAGILGMGAAFVGGILVAYSSFRALQPGDYRRSAWTGAALTGVGVGLTIPVGRANFQKRRAAIEQYNRVVREIATE